MLCNIRLVDSRDSKVLLEEHDVIGDTTYFVTGSLLKTETEALNDAMSDLARRIINKVVENW